MQVSSSTSSISAISSIISSTATSSTAPSPQVSRDSVSVSGPGELFKKLQALATSDPAKFKEAATEIAQKLKDTADASSDPKEKKVLTELSDKFTQAAASGDASGLKPPHHSHGSGGGGHSGPPPSGGSGGASDTSTQTFDPADANQDGVVTEAEQAAYDASKVAKGESSAASRSYQHQMSSSQHEKASAMFSSLNAIVDSVEGSSTSVSA